jgi:hypothetical protein
MVFWWWKERSQECNLRRGSGGLGTKQMETSTLQRKSPSLLVTREPMNSFYPSTAALFSRTLTTPVTQVALPPTFPFDLEDSGKIASRLYAFWHFSSLNQWRRKFGRVTYKIIEKNKAQQCSAFPITPPLGKETRPALFSLCRLY